MIINAFLTSIADLLSSPPWIKTIKELVQHKFSGLLYTFQLECNILHAYDHFLELRSHDGLVVHTLGVFKRHVVGERAGEASP